MKIPSLEDDEQPFSIQALKCQGRARGKTASVNLRKATSGKNSRRSSVTDLA
jgi:hypothetical protein